MDKDLQSALIDLHAELDPYSSHFKRSAAVPSRDQDHQCEFSAAHVAPPNSTAKPVISERIKWDSPPSFHASQFLTNPLVKAAFEDPEVLRLPQELWPPNKPAKVTCKRSELLKLAKRWDDLGAIRLLPSDEKCWDEAVGVFAVGKDSKHDRLIINPQNLNGRMITISEATRSLAPGAMLSLLH